MTYSKPELLAAEAALEAIRGQLKDFGPGDSQDPTQVTIAAYEVDE
jgi:hypothetical protein